MTDDLSMNTFTDCTCEGFAGFIIHDAWNWNIFKDCTFVDCRWLDTLAYGEATRPIFGLLWIPAPPPLTGETDDAR